MVILKWHIGWWALVKTSMSQKECRLWNRSEEHQLVRHTVPGGGCTAWVRWTNVHDKQVTSRLWLQFLNVIFRLWLQFLNVIFSSIRDFEWGSIDNVYTREVNDEEHFDRVFVCFNCDNRAEDLKQPSFFSCSHLSFKFEHSDFAMWQV